jgi:hypothetical protein
MVEAIAMASRLPAWRRNVQRWPVHSLATPAASRPTARPTRAGDAQGGECQLGRSQAVGNRISNAVFDLVAWWAAENRAFDRAHWALRLRRICPFDDEEPFAAIIRCTADPAKVDKRTRSKWSRVLRYTLAHKPVAEPLDQFIKRKGGINKCAGRFARRLGQARE